MSENLDLKTEVQFITSLACAVIGIDGETLHLQFTVVQEMETKKVRCFFVVVDPLKVKIQPDMQ